MEWRADTFMIRCRSGWEPVEGEVAEGLGVWRDFDGGSSFAGEAIFHVTHLASGRLVESFGDLETARIFVGLVRRFPEWADVRDGKVVFYPASLGPKVDAVTAALAAGIDRETLRKLAESGGDHDLIQSIGTGCRATAARTRAPLPGADCQRTPSLKRGSSVPGSSDLLAGGLRPDEIERGDSMTHDKKSAGSDPAFPTGADTYTAKWSVDGGLTKRQLLAGMAMQGMVANGPGIDRLWSTSLEISHDFNARTRWVTLMVAQRAVEVADAVLDLVETPSEADGGTGQSKNG